MSNLKRMATTPLQQIFSDKISADKAGFFYTPELNQRLHLIRHLLQHSEQLLVVMAEQGSGKTTLLTELRQQPESHWQLLNLNGDPQLPEQSLLHALLADMHVKADGKTREGLRDALRSHVAAIRYNGSLPVLLVDDAHMLPLDSLRLLVEFSMTGEVQTRLRVLLCCEPQITSIFSTPEFAIIQNTLIHTLDIPRFTAKQSTEYIQFKMLQAKYKGEVPFSNLQLRKFFQNSEGVPGNLNQQVAQMLDQQYGGGNSSPTASPVAMNFNKIRRKVPKAIPKGWWIFIWSSLFLLTLVLAQQLKQWIYADKTAATPAVVTHQLPSPEPESVTLNPKVNAIPTILPSVKPTQLEPEQPEVENALDPADSSDASQQSGLTGVQSPAWLRRQPVDFYTIQILAAHDKKSLANFLKKRSFQKGVPIALFATQHQQKPWYVLTYGMYTNRELANQARNKLAKKLKNQQPWVRGLANIHQKIDQ